jgi:predicted cupin superfamily sugar epimerase
MTRLEEIMSMLKLRPLPEEGGFFAETYRSDEQIPQQALPERYGGPRSLATAIYYLLTPESFSALHRLRSDEMYHFYAGDPVELTQLRADGSGRIVLLGPEVWRGMQPQITVPRGVWQGSRLKPGGAFALLGTTVFPGFERADYEHGRRDALLQAYPAFRDTILALTR